MHCLELVQLFIELAVALLKIALIAI